MADEMVKQDRNDKPKVYLYVYSAESTHRAEGEEVTPANRDRKGC
jgi:hypothetical protein